MSFFMPYSSIQVAGCWWRTSRTPAGPEQARSPGQFQARALVSCEPLPNKMLQEKARINGLLVCKPISASCAKFELTVLSGEVTLAAMDREEDDG
ncbi:hypothetical protein [Agrobacterium sp.]|uniref:hypothetical protein n=1 Tax=Agrobacterium sp. TaxID=361 RepID=UPI002898D611|nr:hypothetical protein [Agrobacterium sp.]